ncbi:MAG: hydroxyacylglutathione hydrolase C-terminal domain-containing protein, partial [Acidovorax sp.]|nr:hydroxyacylglutathione hydrolase C-terminal domain-containing protein [Acidovorax sp.]
AHEYTLSNLKFARAVEPHNVALLQYIIECESRRRADQPTLPSRIAIERDINPFLRTRVATVAQAAHGFDPLIDPREPAAVLAALRQWKNEFR